MRTTLAILILLGAMSVERNAFSQEVCEAAQPMPKSRLIRRLSLDLRGHIPTYEEAQEIEAAEVEALVDAYLDSDRFLGVMRRYHADLLWPNVGDVQLLPTGNYLVEFNASQILARADRQVACRNSPVEFDELGNIITTPVYQLGQLIGYAEGYVEVEPYWAPGTLVRVCAFDAQDAEMAVACPDPLEARSIYLQGACNNARQSAEANQTPFAGTTVACNSRLAFFAPDCGCGPGLRYCQPSPAAQQGWEVPYMVYGSVVEQELKVIESVIKNERPYHDILLEKEVEFNGPLAHYVRYQAGLSDEVNGGLDTTAAPPDIDFTQSDWVPVSRGGLHSGVLTTPGYLLRFATDRSRAHRFYNAFECSGFVPAGPLPSPFEPCSQHEDLTQRCGCDACHQQLEPMSAHWGRFAESGYKFLSPEAFPAQLDPDRCRESLESLIDCFRYYELDPVGDETPFERMLNPYVFRTEKELQNIEEGPAHLVQASIESGRFSDCTVQKMWRHFMRRAPTAQESAEVLPMLGAHFASNDHNLKALVKAIVMHPAYRRVP